MGIQYHGFLKADWWKPARWWCPDRCYLRFIITISVPRRWWPAKYDGIRMCPYCKERKWMTGSPNFVCPDCSRLMRQLQNMLNGPPWWLHTLQNQARKLWGSYESNKTTQGSEAKEESDCHREGGAMG